MTQSKTPLEKRPIEKPNGQSSQCINQRHTHNP